MVVFYGLNSMVLVAPEDDAYDLVIGVATGALAPADVAEAIGRWVSPRPS